MKINQQKGLTLIEILIVMSITGLLVMTLISGLLRGRVDLFDTARIVIADVRIAQGNALAAKQYNGTYRCGYGLFWLNETSYYLYTGRDPNTNCSPHRFNDNLSTPVILTRAMHPDLEILNPTTGVGCANAGMGANCPNFKDIFFQAPNADIWIGNQQQPNNQNNNLSQILIRKRGTLCSTLNCAYVCVYAFGRIEMRNTPCPKMANPL